VTSPFITTAAAARYLLLTDDGTDTGRPDLVRLHKFLSRYRLTIETVKRGSTTLVDKASLDAHLRRRQSHASHSARRPSVNPVKGVERKSA
jgi:hypothetical protein